ncbi:AraC family transcriptional regulator [Streptococcus suis]|uniref:AraC family transcriptional regulator n=2 Tax=Streptococcus suis TaxID=1307 RepID=A0A7T1LBG6_STRSU|nr:AraC family transcriptional regulator [Streptococcus suis]QPO27307.1 AraC family transcriptional regulator [Streptococcus suis]HEL1785460.1 AraC family transcriptional regulator [Streptococcus suis]HEL1787047.1 AraC family transcriptional regulator [Streptococcus suis]HEL1794988.1 AraC family transcriptional regulator [Streptococcus suis]HEM5158217.1 AraC family transcriptional regulator [Streptococcus suis]
MNILNIYNEFDSHNFDLNVDHYGAEQCDKGYSFGPTIRDNFVLHFITKGRGKILVDGKTSYLAAGDLFILPKDVSIFYQADENEPWTYIWVGFSGSRANDLLNQSQLLENYYLHSSLDSTILDCMYKINHVQMYSTPAITELVLIGYLNQLLAALIEEFPSETLLKPETQTKYYVQQAIKIIHSHYAYPIKVSEIADNLALSRSYLYKIFKQETGYAIKDYILQIKMKRSCQLLEDPSRNITEIAYSVGYQDPLTFSAAFKNYFHMSPTDFRNAQKNKD